MEQTPARPTPHRTLDGLIEELRTPASTAAVRAPAGEAGPPAPPGVTTVLVVESDADVSRTVAQCLAAEHQVITALDGREGLEQALAHRPDLIVSDVVVPGASGEPMVAEVRRRPELDDTPILLLCAEADEALRARLLDEGAQDFVTRPFSARDLLVRARNLVAVKRSREALAESERVRREAIEEANRRLRARSQQLAELFRQAPSFMAVLRGPRHTFELCNTAYDALIGHRDIVGKPLDEALPELCGQGFLELLDRVHATGQPFVGEAVPVLLQREPGAPPEPRYLDFVYQPLRGVDGSVSGVFVEGNDVTERKRAEDALRAADRRKDEFLATLAHELRNPLAPIRHAARISRMPGATAAQVAWAQEVIDRQVEHMARLLDDLLEVSRITRGRLELRRERLALADSLVAAIETARPLIEARRHDLVVDLPSEPLAVDADPVRFAQIFSNLLTNAAKYTDPGGRIRVTAREADGAAVISVRDNGIGIAPELAPHLFEMFSQATAALDRSEGGLGIGLSLAKGLVALHGGSIEARSGGLGTGSEFIVTLPLAPAVREAGAAAEDRSPRAGRARHGLRVLVADDNRDSADGCAMLLTAAGHDVRTAYSGREALAVAEAQRPHVALLDIGMPEMNGYEVAQHLRAAEWGRSITLVAVTGWGQDEDRHLAEAAGFDHHHVKPIELAALDPIFAECARAHGLG